MKTANLREMYNPLNITVRNWPQLAFYSHLSSPPYLSNKRTHSETTHTIFPPKMS